MLLCDSALLRMKIKSRQEKSTPEKSFISPKISTPKRSSSYTARGQRGVCQGCLYQSQKSMQMKDQVCSRGGLEHVKSLLWPGWKWQVMAKKKKKINLLLFETTVCGSAFRSRVCVLGTSNSDFSMAGFLKASLEECSKQLILTQR